MSNSINKCRLDKKVCSSPRSGDPGASALRSEVTNEGVAFVAMSIVLGMIFSPNIYGISVGIVMLLLVAFEYLRGPIGGVGG
jgi:hypothetical protein